MSSKRRRVMQGPDGFTTPKGKPATTTKPRSKADPFAFVVESSNPKLKAPPPPARPPVVEPSSSKPKALQPRMQGPDGFTTPKSKPTTKPRSKKANPFAFVVEPSNPKLKTLQPPPLPSPPSRRLHHLNSILSSEPADLASAFLPALLPEPPDDSDLTQSPSKRGKFLRGGLASRASELFTRSHTALTLWKTDNQEVEAAVRLVVVSVGQDGVVFGERQARFPLSTPPPLTPVLLSGLTTPPKLGSQLLVYKPYQTLPFPHAEPLLISARYRVSAA